jgi:hypothetical protein
VPSGKGEREGFFLRQVLFDVVENNNQDQNERTSEKKSLKFYDDSYEIVVDVTSSSKAQES